MPFTDDDRRREYQRKRLAKKRVAYMADKSCVFCGSRENLEVDHIDRSTKATSSFWSWSWERINEEMKKCQILCHDCHKMKTIEVDLPQIVGKELYQHGTRSMYRRHGCRCDLCRSWNAERMRKNRAGIPQRPSGGAF